ncbi:MAG: carboxymuconolactone decarboxylase family protein [Janthinobacterium lividum]
MANFKSKVLATIGLLALPTIVLAAVEAKRFKQLTVEELTPAQHQVADEVLKVSSLGIQGPYNVILRSPVMAQRQVALLDYIRFNTSVPRRLNEFAILIQARLWTSQVEWKAHYPLAIKAGLSEAVAADLRDGKRPAGMQPDEAVVYDLCVELATTHEVADATFARARQLMSEQQIVDLVTVSGTYVLVAMQLAAGKEGTPDGSSPLAPMPAGWTLH